MSKSEKKKSHWDRSSGLAASVLSFVQEAPLPHPRPDPIRQTLAPVLPAHSKGLEGLGLLFRAIKFSRSLPFLRTQSV